MRTTTDAKATGNRRSTVDRPKPPRTSAIEGVVTGSGVNFQNLLINFIWGMAEGVGFEPTVDFHPR